MFNYALLMQPRVSRKMLVLGLRVRFWTWRAFAAITINSICAHNIEYVEFIVFVAMCCGSLLVEELHLFLCVRYCVRISSQLFVACMKYDMLVVQ